MRPVKILHIEDINPVEAIRASSTDARYLTIHNEGPGTVLACLGGNASIDNFNLAFPPGFNDANFPLGKESFSLICPLNQSAKIRIGIFSRTDFFQGYSVPEKNFLHIIKNDIPSNSKSSFDEESFLRESSEKKKMQILSSKIFINLINSEIRRINSHNTSFPSIDYRRCAKESVKAARSLMKEWEALEKEGDDTMPSRSLDN